MDLQSPQGAQECESVEKSPQERSRGSSEGPELRGDERNRHSRFYLNAFAVSSPES